MVLLLLAFAVYTSSCYQSLVVTFIVSLAMYDCSCQCSVVTVLLYFDVVSFLLFLLVVIVVIVIIVVVVNCMAQDVFCYD